MRKNTKYTKQRYPLPQDSGVILIGALMTLLFFMVISVAVAEFGSRHYLNTRRTLVALNALSVAEAGADKFMVEVNNNTNYTGSAGAVTLYSDSVKGKATYETTVASGTIPNEKVVTSVGKIYLPATAATPLVTRTIKATIIGTIPVPYAVQTGPGGLTLAGSAAIGSGDVYVNGTLNLSGATRIGSTSTPANVYVANANCPTSGGSTYPSVCSSGQPIIMSGSPHIYGTVRATGQTNGSNMSKPGLVSGSTAPVVGLPADNRSAQVAAVTSTVTGSSASCGGASTRTFQANTHITGNLTVGNSCVATIKGDLWIDGNLTVNGAAVFRVDPSVTDTVNIMVDGSTGVTLGGSGVMASNASGVGFKVVTYYSAASCSPGCSSLTGTELYNSRNIITMNLGNAGLGAGSIFYARWTKVVVANSGSIGAVMGQTVLLNGAGTISFGGASTGTSGTTWDVRYYQQYFR